MADAAQSGAVRVVLPRALVDLFPGASTETTVPGGTVGQVLDAVDARWPGMRDRLVDSRPAIRKHINVFVDGTRQTLDAEVRPGATVFILTAISGG